MSTAVTASFLLLCLAGAVLAGRALNALLSERHWATGTQDTVKLALGLVATMAAVLLGLLVSAAKTSYDEQKHQVVEMAARIRRARSPPRYLRRRRGLGACRAARDGAKRGRSRVAGGWLAQRYRARGAERTRRDLLADYPAAHAAEFAADRDSRPGDEHRARSRPAPRIARRERARRRANCRSWSSS